MPVTCLDKTEKNSKPSTYQPYRKKLQSSELVEEKYGLTKYILQPQQKQSELS